MQYPFIAISTNLAVIHSGASPINYGLLAAGQSGSKPAKWRFRRNPTFKTDERPSAGPERVVETIVGFIHFVDTVTVRLPGRPKT
jgi:hypothetical protein